MPKFLEDRLRAEAVRKGMSEKQQARYVYGALNNLGMMRGNQETAKGVRAEAKHEADMTKSSDAPVSKPRAAGGVPHPHANLGKYLHPSKKR